MLFLTLLLWALALVSGNDGGCKRYPIPVDLGNPLPYPITQLFSALDKIFEDAVYDNNLVGGAMSLRYNGKELFSTGKGYADLAKGTPFTPKTKTRVASVSKLFTALMLNQYASVGVLNIHDPVKKWCPTFRVPSIFSGTSKDVSDDITFFRLASHLSGLHRESPGYQTTAEVFAALQYLPIIVPPGSVPSYSNLGFSLLGNVLADCVDRNSTFANLLDHWIIQPLNLKNTGVTYTSTVMNSLAKGYVGVQEVPFVNLGWDDPSGGIYSSAEDLTLLGDTILADAARDMLTFSPSPFTLNLRPSIARDLLRPVSRNPDGITYIGAPWEMLSFNIASKTPDTTPADTVSGYEEPARLRHQGAKEVLHGFTPFLEYDSNYSMPKDASPAIQTLAATFNAQYLAKKQEKFSTLTFKGPVKGGEYVVRVKEGSLPGYASIIAVVPELNISVSAVFNSPFSGGALLQIVMPYILEAFEASLYAITAPYPIESVIGPQPYYYVGNFVNPYTGGVVQITLYNGNKNLVLYFNDYGFQMGAYLVYVAESSPTGSIYRLYFAPESMSCMLSELLAVSGQYVFFEKNAAGLATSFQIPGFVPQVIYYRN